MSDAIIFVVGSIVFLMVSFGLGFTVIDVRRLDQEALDKPVGISRNKMAG
jgi:hypothetical protein